MAGWKDNAKERAGDWIIVVGVVAAGIALAVSDSWPFNAEPRQIADMPSPSIWQYILADRWTLGFGRRRSPPRPCSLVASLAALALGGRWMSGFGGLTVDEKTSTKQRITALENRLRTTEDELDEQAQKRQEAEDWAYSLIDEVDGLRLELDNARELLAERGEDEHQDDGIGDPHPAG